MSETEEKLLTVKEYAAENHVSRQSVSSKINRHKDELKGHVFIINGRKMLDGFAQDFLKPTKDNALLISKNAELEKSLENEKNVSKQNKSLANSQGNKVKVMTVELETKDKLIAEYEDRIKNLIYESSEELSKWLIDMNGYDYAKFDCKWLETSNELLLEQIAQNPIAVKGILKAYKSQFETKAISSEVTKIINKYFIIV